MIAFLSRKASTHTQTCASNALHLITQHALLIIYSFNVGRISRPRAQETRLKSCARIPDLLDMHLFPSRAADRANQIRI